MPHEPTPPEKIITPEQTIRNLLGSEGGLTGKSVDELEKESKTDHLTGLLNRRGFDDQLEKAYERAKRTGSKLQIIFIDADKFHDINTKYLYEGGDQALISIAQGLRHTFRTYDELARWGGDEFVAIALDESFKEQAKEQELQERLNAKVKELRPVGFDINDLSVTVGVVNWDGVSSLTDLKAIVNKHMAQRK